MKPEAFISLEDSVTHALISGLKTQTQGRLEEIDQLAARGELQQAHDLVDHFEFEELPRGTEEALKSHLTSAYLFGAQGPARSPSETHLARSLITYPDQLTSALGQLSLSLRLSGTETLRREGHAWVDEHKEGSPRPEIFRKADRVPMVSRAEKLMRTQANLSVSRTASFGFLQEADLRGYDSYQVNEVLDSRTCSVCRYMHGKTFEVRQELTRVSSALMIQDPAELKTAAPWPNPSRAGLRRVASMSSEELQAEGYGSPPYHPGCRGILAMTGTVAEEIPLGQLLVALPQLVEEEIQDTL